MTGLTYRRHESGRPPSGTIVLTAAAPQAYGAGVWTVVVILLVVWAILAVVGFVFEGLLWLAIIGLILFAGTLAGGLVRRSRRKSAS
jgi:hypothetical protein